MEENISPQYSFKDFKPRLFPSQIKPPCLIPHALTLQLTILNTTRGDDYLLFYQVVCQSIQQLVVDFEPWQITERVRGANALMTIFEFI